MSDAHLQDSRHLARVLADLRTGSDHAVLVTWLNHFTALDADPAQLRHFDYVGVDGLFLKSLIRAEARTSADMVVPLLLPLLRGARIMAIGGSRTDGSSRSLTDALQRMAGEGSRVVEIMDGYHGLMRAERLAHRVDELNCDVLLIGLGAVLQDAVAIEARASKSARLILTCGGLLDQLMVDDYYPKWAYPLRLNWLVRVAREPGRLWRRYTIDAVRAVRSRRRLMALTELPGFRAAESLAATRLESAAR